jgi:VanZ family protein
VRRWRVIRYAPLLIWIALIFTLSSEVGAMSRTSRFVRPLLEFLFPAASEETLVFYHAIVRKLAHLAEYAVLAVFAAQAFGGSPRAWLSRNWFLVSFALVTAVAVTDEAQQSFRASRTGSALDVLIDLAGGISMILLIVLFGIYRTRQQSSTRI